MAPKVKITEKSIVETAIALVRSNGENAINARAIASALNCSTQPIFSNFSTMEALRNAAISYAYEIYTQFLKNEIEIEKYPKYKSMGMAYIRFAREEKNLFKLLFMRDRRTEDLSPSPDFNESVELLAKVNSITQEQANLMHLEIWAFTHGIATMIATSFLPLEEDLISSMLSDVYNGIKSKYLSEKQ